MRMAEQNSESILAVVIQLAYVPIFISEAVLEFSLGFAHTVW